MSQCEVENEHNNDVDIDKAGLREVANACIGYVAAVLSVRRGGGKTSSGGLGAQGWLH